MRWAHLTAGVTAFGLAACQPAAENAAIDHGDENRVLPLPTLPIVDPPINREGLLLAVARAASAAALGSDDAAEQRKLDGRRFEVRIRFGCGSVDKAPETNGPFSVRFDEKSRTLRISASPDLGIDDAPVAALARETPEGPSGNTQRPGIEAVEGFWIERPWLLADGCPAIRSQGQDPMEMRPEPAKTGDEPATAGPASVPSAGQRVGLAEFFTSADSRTGRRDRRAYELTKVLGEDEQASAQGYNIVLSGRLRAQPVGRVISCPLVADHEPPRCVVSAEFDRVLIERPDSKEILANWGS